MRKLSVSHRAVITVVLAGVIALATVALSDVAKVSAIRVENSAVSAKYVIEQTGTADYQEFLLSNPTRLVVDFIGARHALDKSTFTGDGKLVMGVRTSQFTNDPDEVTRVVFDLNDGTKYKIAKNGSAVEVSFFGRQTGAPSIAGPDESSMKASFGTAWDPAAGQVTPGFTPENREVAHKEKEAAKPIRRPLANAPASSPASGNRAWSSPAAPPETVVDAGEPHEDVERTSRWTQSRGSDLAWNNFVRQGTALQSAGSMLGDRNISMDVQGADIKTVLRSISEFSGANIVAGPEVEGPVTVHLVDVPWREALDMILKANSYGVREEYGIIRVQALEKLNDEEIDIAQVIKQKEDLEPLVSRVIKLNYTNAKEMKNAMKSVATKRGSVEFERDNNAVIINDIPKVADRIAEMVVGLDTKVNQVEIIAKMVDVDVEATREIGVQWDALNFMSTELNANADFKSGREMADPFGTLRVGTVNSWGDVMATVQALERDNKADIISNPRITTTDNKEANILVGKEIPLIVTDEAGNPITELKKVGITLRVTPHVNSDQTITLDLHPEISELSAQATVQGGVIISLSEADTRVIVGDGETAVIAGLINEVESDISNGLPILQDLPVLGSLFRFESKTKKKRELIIFVTPRIVGEFASSETTGN